MKTHVLFFQKESISLKAGGTDLWPVFKIRP